MTISQLESRIAALDAAYPFRPDGGNRMYKLAREERWWWLQALRDARQRAGLPITGNGSQPHYGKPEPSYRMENVG